jgi:hypothetical protein
MAIKWQSLLDIHHFKLQDAWVIFFACLWIYAGADVPLKGRALTSLDSTGNALVAFNWLFNGTLDFDNFRQGAYYSQGQPLYVFRESVSGHLASTYPIGVAIVSFPIYVGFALLLWISHGFQAVDITGAAFFEQRLLFERLAAALMTSFSVVLFYQLSRIKFERSIALISTFIYGFATNVWVINSQALWQHGASNLVLLAIILCFVKANCVPAFQKLLIFNAGILAGFLIGIRPINVAFVIGIILYAIAIYRRQVVFFLLGLSSLGLTLGWNWYFFQSLTGGYGEMENLYWFSFEQFIAGMSGILFSPSRGLLIYTPILLLAIPGVIILFQNWKHRDAKLFILLLFACIPIFLQYCFFRVWWAGTCYGPRFICDFLPLLCFATNHAILHNRVKIWIIAALLLFSVNVQIFGVFGANAIWEGSPTFVLYNPSQPGLYPDADKFWQIRDSQIERSARTLLFRITHPTRQPNYVRGLDGKLLDLRDENHQPLSVIKKPKGYRMRTYATVQNTGTSQWFGYTTGADALGEMRVQALLLDAKGQVLEERWLFISGILKPGERTIAMGDLFMPLRPGKYTLKFALVAEGIGNIPLLSPAEPLSLAVEVPDS